MRRHPNKPSPQPPPQPSPPQPRRGDHPTTRALNGGIVEEGKEHVSEH